MKLKRLIQQFRYENSAVGDATREITKDEKYLTLQDESKFKDYFRKKLFKKGMLNGFVELLFVHELINSN
tara:strand:- start:29531 stop:29740 length:210 start_codon:yes stop_codon:yes gene_type:complete